MKPWLLFEAKRPTLWILLFITTVAVSSCGGNSGGNSNAGNQQATVDSTTPNSNNVVDEINPPVPTGQTAIDGYHWFNFRRRQMGLAIVSENALISSAAQAHSDYQRLNQTITHLEVPDRQGYTGITLADRLSAAQYQLPRVNYAYGEVISATGYTSGILAAELLLGAIYHRFVILEPKFTEAGVGAATATNGYTYFTTNFASNDLFRAGLGNGRLVAFPFPGQQEVPTTVFSDEEEPDPVPDQNEVGYPVSVHADITSVVQVDSFTMHPRGGEQAATRLLTREWDGNISFPSVAAIIPLDALQPKTDYDVQFTGTVDDLPINLTWSFKTQ